MKFPDHVVGPKFEEGDIVTFILDDATLMLRVPSIHLNRSTKNYVSTQVDFRDADISCWRYFGDQELCSKSIVKQTWTYEDEISHEDFAHAFFEVTILRHNDADHNRMMTLNTKSFHESFLNDIKENFSDSVSDKRRYWPTLENNFFAKSIVGKYVDGLQVQLDLGGGGDFPVPLAYFSLGRRYSLRVEFHFGSLHCSGQKNPFSDDIWRGFMSDLFDDLVSHIHIEYTPETIALIEQLKKQNES